MAFDEQQQQGVTEHGGMTPAHGSGELAQALAKDLFVRGGAATLRLVGQNNK